MSNPRDPRVTSTDGHDPDGDPSDAPGPVNPATGQHASYWILTAEERAKGFVRPVRTSYVHVGSRPQHPTRPLTPEELARHGAEYACFEVYPPEMAPRVGRFWSAADLKSGCGQPTRMSREIAETYARDPSFYGATFCVRCRAHLPVGANGEFVWLDEHGRTTAEKVGT
jgi:hypothetical protein